ncbi:MAG: phage tail protein [Rivularia sp. (in: cyanobacteria)]
MNTYQVLSPHCFYLELSLDNSKEKVDVIFLECRGFQRTQEVIEICEVTSNKFGAAKKGMPVRTKIPGNARSGNLTLLRGMSSSIALWDWFQSSHDNWAKQRRNLSLTLYDPASKGQARYELTGAWPTSYKFGDVGARSKDVEIEEVEIAFEEFKRVKVS